MSQQTLYNDLVITGDLTVSGTTTTINTNNLTVEDKNIIIGNVTALPSVSISGYIASSTTTTTITGISPSTTGMVPGQILTKVIGGGVLGANATITSVDSSTAITITSTTPNTVGTLVFDVGGANNTTADGGGITLKGTTDKTFNWVSSTNRWTSNVGVEASALVRTGGTTAQFLKADGTTQELTTGKTIYVDAGVGTDTRPGFNEHDISEPFATIGEAVSASASGDTVYVRAGSYTISTQISLNGKGNIYFETGTDITVAGNTVAFSLTPNETETKTVNGFARFTLSGTANILTQSNGTLFLEYQSITSTSTDTLFKISGGTLNTSFAIIDAAETDGFVLTGSGTLVIRRSHTATCKQFLNCNTSGAVTMDLWTAVGTSSDATIRVVNHLGFSYRGVNLNNNSSSPCIVFAYTGGTGAPVLRNLRLSTGGTGISINAAAATRDIFLDQIKINAANSLSATAPTTVYSTTTYSKVAPDTNVTVDGQYNIMSKLF